LKGPSWEGRASSQAVGLSANCLEDVLRVAVAGPSIPSLQGYLAPCMHITRRAIGNFTFVFDGLHSLQAYITLHYNYRLDTHIIKASYDIVLKPTNLVGVKKNQPVKHFRLQK